MKNRAIERPVLRGRLLRSLRENPAVALVGPRQCGNTTLAQ
jgi:predicted AAA+ superfamily ATPase